MTPQRRLSEQSAVEQSARAMWRSIAQHCFIIFNTWAYVATFVPSTFRRRVDEIGPGA